MKSKTGKKKRLIISKIQMFNKFKKRIKKNKYLLNKCKKGDHVIYSSA